MRKAEREKRKAESEKRRVVCDTSRVLRVKGRRGRLFTILAGARVEKTF